MEDKKISKFISYVLRHKPEEAGLTLDASGWVGVDDLIAAVRAKFKVVFNREHLQRIVDESDKARFTIRDDQIRANQGHSVDLDLGLEAQVPPAQLYHGTKKRFLEAIMAEGLHRGSRHHVHLSTNLDTATQVADRRHGESVILVVDTRAMDQDFFLSDNGVWLTHHVDPQWITVLD